jgi:hypothetical protein
MLSERSVCFVVAKACTKERCRIQSSSLLWHVLFAIFHDDFHALLLTVRLCIACSLLIASQSMVASFSSIRTALVNGDFRILEGTCNLSQSTS